MDLLVTLLHAEGLLGDESAQQLSSRDVVSVAELVADHDVAPSAIVRRAADVLGKGYLDLEATPPDPSVAVSVSEAICRRHVVLPHRVDEFGELHLAMADPSNLFALDDVRNATGRDPVAHLAARDDILTAIDKAWSGSAEMEELSEGFADADDGAEDLSQLREVSDDAPIVRFVNAVITRAVAERASDIHIEPGERDLRVRYRVDGVLHEMMRSPKQIASGVVSRLKIMSELDIAERRVPQDGRISLRVADRSIDLRVSTLPTVYGEKVVMRILDTSSVLLELSDLGFMPDNYAKFEESFRKPYGMILVTGPTGSGKSTSLYATLNILNDPEVNITTVENPVEYRLGGVNQVPINNKTGMTFAAALRSILRQDPDIVLVGETRDPETAQIAIEAALTGHLVLTTLHTNDAPSAITRLTEMGVEPFLVGSAVDAVLAQRLARRLCTECKRPYRPDPHLLVQAGFDDGEQVDELFEAVGCAKCGMTGYRGRLALHEVMNVDEGIERLTVERASSEEIKRYAITEQGMSTLRRDGLEKVRMGLTTIEEVGRVVV